MSHRLAIGSFAAAVVFGFAPAFAPLRGDTGADTGADTGSDNCNFDVKKVDASSTCLQSTWCGGAHGGAISIGGVSVTAGSGGGSVDCCMTEFVIPPHTEIVAGDKRIVHVTDVLGYLITRRCSSPFTLFGLELGSWTCSTDTITASGKYPVDSAIDCEKPKDTSKTAD